MTLSAFLSVIVLLAIGFVVLYVLSIYLKYRKSSYKDASGNSFLQILFDKGNYGEFLIFSRLEKLERHHRLLTNIYLPKSDGSTTEIDILMIAETGIYVFESKNYSGWIFGDEKGRNWTQVLENKQKNHFYNPVWQNKVFRDRLHYLHSCNIVLDSFRAGLPSTVLRPPTRSCKAQ